VHQAVYKKEYSSASSSLKVPPIISQMYAVIKKIRTFF